MPLPAPVSKRVIADLGELAKLTSSPEGAQRVAWGPVWRKARAWFEKKVRTDLGLRTHRDAAGNNWVTLPGASKVMVFAQSSPGISHCKEEDTPIPHLDRSIRAFLTLAENTVADVAAR